METKYCTNCRFCIYDKDLDNWKCCARGCVAIPSRSTNCGLYMRETQSEADD